MVISLDGVLVPPEAARISVLDRGLLYGDGCFEVLRTFGGVARELEAHLDRLFETVVFLKLQTIGRGELTSHVHGALAAAGAGEHRVRVMLTRGPGPLSARTQALGPGHAIVVVEPLPELPPETSLALIDLPLPARRSRGHKLLAYADHVVGRELAQERGAGDGIRLDAWGCVAECATANIFIVTGGALVTPPVDRGILPGIVRARVLGLAPGLGIAAQEAPIALEALYAAEEVFTTSALRGVVPVTRLDGEPRPAGPITQRLAHAYLSGPLGL